MGIRAEPPGTLVTLVEGGSFCVSGPSCDIAGAGEGAGHGLYIADRRLLSRLVLSVNDHRVEPVDHHHDDPAAATFVARVARGAHGHPAGPGEAGGSGAAGVAGAARPGLVVVRRRTIDTGLRDQIEVRNPGDEPSYV